MDYLCKGHMIADVAAVLGSLDIVFGEIESVRTDARSVISAAASLPRTS